MALSDVVRRERESILERWSREAARAASARGLSEPELQNIVPRFLAELARPEHTRATLLVLLDSHLGTRVRLGFDLAEIIEEFRVLGRVLLAACAPDGGADESDRAYLRDLLDASILRASELFQAHMRDDEQREKRLLKRLQTVADEALRSASPPRPSALKAFAELVMEAMEAQTAGILLFDPASGRLFLDASAGTAENELRRFNTSLSLTSFAGAAAASEQPTAVLDAVSTELEISDELRASGIHALLGMRLPARHSLVGVVYVGLREQRAFSGRELARLELLADRLTLHLDNARLYADLRARIDDLVAEREVRERFVAILTHDLRGPLTAARVSTEVLASRSGELRDAERRVVGRIRRNLDRIDRMTQDMLDVSRMRAGEGLALKPTACDLGALAAEVVAELAATYGDRFELVADPGVTGFWSPGELRRALWNLGTNAVKYGARDQTVTVRVERTPDAARLSVHNVGEPIGAELQPRLFELFTRGDGGAPRGWGLGLALVKACAQAHHGRIGVRSDEGHGTTFWMELPWTALLPATTGAHAPPPA